MHCPAEIYVVWRRAYVALNLYITFNIHSAIQNMQAAHTICTYAPPYNQRCWLLNWTLMTRWKVSLLFCTEDTAYVISNKNITFELVWPQKTFPLWNSPFYVSLGPQDTTALLGHVHIWLPFCTKGLISCLIS